MSIQGVPPVEEPQHDNSLNVPLITRCFWPQAVTSSKCAPRVVFVMRSAERVDRVFGANWLTTEAPTGRLIPTDLNVPNSIRKLLHTGIFANNTPITTLGKYRSQLVARAIQNRGLKPSVVHCSPALRCIQTASAIAEFLDVKVAIEPGLLEHGMTMEEMHLDTIRSMYNVSADYLPIMSSLPKDETAVDALHRIDFVLRNMAAQPRDKPMLVVAHAATQHVACEMARTSPKGSDDYDNEDTSYDVEGELKMDLAEKDMVELGLRFPPGSVISLIQKNQAPPHRFTLCPSMIPPLSYGRYFSSKPILFP